MRFYGEMAVGHTDIQLPGAQPHPPEHPATPMDVDTTLSDPYFAQIVQDAALVSDEESADEGSGEQSDDHGKGIPKPDSEEELGIYE